MNAKLYQLHTGNELDGADLVEGFTAEVPCDHPDDPRCPKAEYYCHNRECRAREVVVSAAHVRGDLPPARCPYCGQPLRLCNYLREVLLVPVDRAET